MIEITSLEDKRVELYNNLRKIRDDHLNKKVFVAEGEKVVKRLLNSNLEIESIFALAEYYEKFEELIQYRLPHKDKCFFANRELMNDIAGFRLHTGIMAISKMPTYVAINDMEFPIVALNGIVNSENVGSIVRNCAAFGCNSLIFDSKTSSPYMRRAVRVSMGTIFDIKIHESNKLLESLKKLKKDKNCLIISAEINENSIDFRQIDSDKDYILIFGSESKGIDSEILNISDFVAHIPISEAVPSLNVAASSAIMLYELMQ